MVFVQECHVRPLVKITESETHGSRDKTGIDCFSQKSVNGQGPFSGQILFPLYFFAGSFQA